MKWREGMSRAFSVMRVCWGLVNTCERFGKWEWDRNFQGTNEQELTLPSQVLHPSLQTLLSFHSPWTSWALVIRFIHWSFHWFVVGLSCGLFDLVTWTSRFTTNDCNLHVFDFDSHKKKEHLANHHILQVIPKCSPGFSHVADIEGQNSKTKQRGAHLDLLYSNSMWRQSSIPTSILMLLLISGSFDELCTQKSKSLVMFGAYCLFMHTRIV